MADDRSLSCPQCGRRYAEPADRCTVDGSPLYGPEVLERLGTRINNYQVHSILGEGGMGVVYKGEHVMLGKPVAIKILHERFARREGAADQFLREARAASQVRHPNIVDVTDFGETSERSVYFVMEYLEGESLEDVLARDHHIELFNAVNVVRQVAHALAAAHDHGVVHLDLKPENIFLINREGRRRIVRRVEDEEAKRFVVEKEGNFDFVKLLDFGVAKFTQDSLGPGLGTRSGMVFGTPHYMSPEQARGETVDCRSDVYSLGILFYEMILGEVPFEGDVALDVLNAHVSESPIPPSQRNGKIHVDPGTDRTIMRCLEKDPKARFQTMDELVEALLDCFTDRVYLRDVDRLPGAVESGIAAPEAAPIRKSPPTPEIAHREVAKHQLEEQRRKSSLTDELSELFGHKRKAAPKAEPAVVDLAQRAKVDPAAGGSDRASDTFGDEEHASPRSRDHAPKGQETAKRQSPSKELSRRPTGDARRPPATAPAQPARQRRPTSPGLGGQGQQRTRKATAPLGSGAVGNEDALEPQAKPPGSRKTP